MNCRKETTCVRAPPVSFSICSIVPLCSVEMLSAFEPFLGGRHWFFWPICVVGPVMLWLSAFDGTRVLNRCKVLQTSTKDEVRAA